MIDKGGLWVFGRGTMAPEEAAVRSWAFFDSLNRQPSKSDAQVFDLIAMSDCLRCLNTLWDYIVYRGKQTQAGWRHSIWAPDTLIAV